jgi:hypothetical protein
MNVLQLKKHTNNNQQSTGPNMRSLKIIQTHGYTPCEPPGHHNLVNLRTICGRCLPPIIWKDLGCFIMRLSHLNHNLASTLHLEYEV